MAVSAVPEIRAANAERLVRRVEGAGMNPFDAILVGLAVISVIVVAVIIAGGSAP